MNIIVLRAFCVFFFARNEIEKERDVLYDFETVRTVNEFKCEFVTTMREGMRNWNMSVQYWLATVVYKQFPIKSLK